MSHVIHGSEFETVIYARSIVNISSQVSGFMTRHMSYCIVHVAMFSTSP